MLKALTTIKYDALTESQQIDVLRAFEIILSRMGIPEPATKNIVIGYLNNHYPARTNNLNRSLSKVLAYLEAPQVVERTIAMLETAQDDPMEKMASQSSDLILRNPRYGMDIAEMLSNVPPQQQTYYAVALSTVKAGWTPALREQYFSWIKKAFGYKGGLSYIGFINKARQNALKNVPADQLEHFKKASGEELLANEGNELVEGPQPKGPWRRWKLEEALTVVEGNLANRSFDQGKIMFDAARCSSCHSMGGRGTDIGPDQIGRAHV